MHNINEYKKLSDVEHVLLRSGVYIGSIDETEFEEYIFKEDKFELKKVKYVPGLLKIANEVLDNSVDEAIRTKFQFATKIKVTMTESSLEIEDNGRGIPIELMKGTEDYIPVVLFTSTKAGSNFSDDKRETAGTNGLGSTLANIFSLVFKVVTQDTKHKLVLNCSENNLKHTFKISDSAKNGTTVYFEPDFKRFKLTKFSQIYFDLMYQRLIFLSHTYPDITFYFNGDKISNVNDKKFISYFLPEYEYISTDNITIALGVSNEDSFKQLSYVNGLAIRSGGNHIKYISEEIVNVLREKLEKRYKAIKPGDIKNKLYLCVFFKGFPNMRFDSQTKETLTNSISEIKDFTKDIDLIKLGKQLIKNESIFFAIEESYKIKEEFQQRKELSNVVKTAKKVKVEKYLPPIDEYKYLVLAEGDSAISGISPVLGRKHFGYFPLRGKPLNTYDAKLPKVLANEELMNIIRILDVDLSKEVTDMAYENILIASDADLDGFQIRGGILTFFNRFMPKLLEQGRIKFLNTPIMYTKDKNGTATGWVYDMREVSKLKGQVHYSKGLGSWKVNTLKSVIEKDGLENMIKSFDKDKDSQKYIELWMGNDSDLRKEQIKGKSFSYSEM